MAKRGPVVLSAYYRLIMLTPCIVVPLPPKTQQRAYRDIVGEKDEHVVAAAIAANALFLLTLDKKLTEAVNQSKLPIQAISPGDFIKTVLPQHPDYN